MAELLATEIRPGVFDLECLVGCEGTEVVTDGVEGVVRKAAEHLGIEVIDVDQARDYLAGTEQLKIVRMEET